MTTIINRRDVKDYNFRYEVEYVAGVTWVASFRTDDLAEAKDEAEFHESRGKQVRIIDNSET